MVKFNKKHWDEIEKGFNNSPVWKEINERIKNTYKKHNRKPTDEEYQMVRQIMACKAILEDENIMSTINKCTWEAVKGNYSII